MTNQTTQTPEVTAVLENQTAIKTTIAAIDKLEKAIAKCQTQIAEQQAALPDMVPLSSQRAVLLADMAIGEDKKAEIGTLDAKIAQVTAHHKDAKPALEVLKQTVDGLQRRLQEAQAELLTLQSARSILILRLLNSQAEALGAEYVVAASKLAELYKGMIALDAMLREHGQGHHILMHGQGLHVPCFLLDSMSGKADFTYKNALFASAHNTYGHVQEWTSKVKVKMLEIGVDLA